MAQLDSRIPMMGTQPNVVNALAGGAQAASAVNMVRRQNALTDLYEQQGPGIMSGDPNALNALAQLSPQDALGIQNSQQIMDVRGQENARADEQLQLAREQARRQAEAQAAQLSAAERASELEALQRGLAGAAAINDPQQWDSYMQSLGLEQMVGQFDNREIAFASALGIKDALERAAGPEANYQIIDGQYVDTNNPQAGARDVPNLRREGDASEAEQEIARLLEIPGVSRETAIKIKEGVYRVYTDPVDRTTYIIDLATQQPVQIIGADGSPTGGSQPAAPTGQMQPGQQPAAQPQNGLSFGQDIPTGGESAFGLTGLGTNIANTVSDAVGMGEVFPNAAEQQRFFRLMEEDLLVDLSQAYGRQPAQQLMERIRALLPQAGTLEGADRARGELAQLRRRFSRDLEQAESTLRAPGRRMKPEDRDALRNQVGGLQSTLGTIDEALTRLGAAPDQQGSTGGTTSSGVQWSVEQ
ncbi:hypothetical protein [Citreimonas salinaria]|uniref:Uncharacterized protein n=1 Tax=Citreimonas salinaria TaxID=321339 RepID=A0A1H3MHS6_9RHOB|nr:hypothetical protein [Citreimonas salinaria]SDY75729.1 hypothetical protein SAMN05444340_11712 [Citreimonas salinaria]